jgi:secreted PhoX family phosphatase
MPTFKRVEGEDNLFVDENGNNYTVTDGEMKEIEIEVKPKELTFEERLAMMDEKIKEGVIKCNLDNPEDCEACGS